MTDFDPVAVLKELEQMKGDSQLPGPRYLADWLKAACEEVVRLREVSGFTRRLMGWKREDDHEPHEGACDRCLFVRLHHPTPPAEEKA